MIVARDVDLGLHQRVLRRGLQLRLLCNPTVLYGATDQIPELTAAGAQFRVTHKQIDPMIIIDERVAVIPTDPGDCDGGGMVVRQPSLLSSLLGLYHARWHDARTIDDHTQDSATLDSTDRRILELLASGATDEMVSRSVGISARHVRRRVAAIMEHLDVTSRFEAGKAAAHRGWI